MVHLHYAAKELLSTPGVRRNFRVVFPDGERADLTSADVEENSVRMTESVCSDTVFRYGCCERSMIEFTAVGVENILGCRIQCFLEFDTTGLADIVIEDLSLDGEVVSEEDSDLGWGYFRFPYGEYLVASCPRDHARRSHRSVKAYSPDPTVISEVERVRLNTYIPVHSSFSAGLLSLAAANIAYRLPGVFDAWGWVDKTDTVPFDYYTWTEIQTLGVSETATFSVTADGHVHSVEISGTYAVIDWTDKITVYADDPAECRPASVRLSGWHTDEAWTWYQDIFAGAGISTPAVAAHARLPRTWLQPHIGQDKLDQYGPYDHAPIYWLPDGGCPFFIEQMCSSSLDASTFTRLMWDVTVTYKIDGVPEAQKTFFPLADLTARVGFLRMPITAHMDTELTYDSTNSYTRNNVEMFAFTGAYDPIKVLGDQIEIEASDVRIDRYGVPWIKNLKDIYDPVHPVPDVPSDMVEELFWDDAEISPIGQVQYQTERWTGEKKEPVWGVEYGSGGESIYELPSNMVILAKGATYVRDFIQHLPARPIVPYDGVIHNQPWLEPGDYVNVMTSDPDFPTLRICILSQSITGVQDLRHEVSASGGTVYFEGNAFGKDVTMIFGQASGGGAAGAAQSSSGGGGEEGSDAYQPGDTLTLGAYVVSNGLITSSTETVRFMVVTPKTMAGITTVTATNLSAELRGANGYLNSQSGFYDYANRSGYTVSCAKATDNMIRVNITKSSTFSNVSNNTPVSVNLGTTVTFEFA